MENGMIAKEIRYGHIGIISNIFNSWDDLKSKQRFLTIDPQEDMDYIEKLINGDPKDNWLKYQSIPFTDEQLNEKWYSIKCFDGGSIWTCESRIEVINHQLN